MSYDFLVSYDFADFYIWNELGSFCKYIWNELGSFCKKPTDYRALRTLSEPPVKGLSFEKLRAAYR